MHALSKLSFFSSSLIVPYLGIYITNIRVSKVLNSSVANNYAYSIPVRALLELE